MTRIRLAWLASVAILLYSTVAVIATSSRRFPAPAPIRHASLLTIEVPESLAELRGVLYADSPDANRAVIARLELAQRFDMVFPLLYGAFLVIAAWFAALSRGRPRWPALGAAFAAFLVFGAAVMFDYLENFVIARVLGQSTGNLQPLLDPLKHAARMKWGVLGAGMLLLGMVHCLVVPPAENPTRFEALRAIAAVLGGTCGIVGALVIARGLFGVQSALLSLFLLSLLWETTVRLRNQGSLPTTVRE